MQEYVFIVILIFKNIIHITLLSQAAHVIFQFKIASR
jgi:hypothetical protein